MIREGRETAPAEDKAKESGDGLEAGRGLLVRLTPCGLSGHMAPMGMMRKRVGAVRDEISSGESGCTDPSMVVHCASQIVILVQTDLFVFILTF